MFAIKCFSKLFYSPVFCKALEKVLLIHLLLAFPCFSFINQQKSRLRHYENLALPRILIFEKVLLFFNSVILAEPKCTVVKCCKVFSAFFINSMNVKVRTYFFPESFGISLAFSTLFVIPQHFK